MLARIKSAAISGLDAAPIEVEVRAAEGKENFTIIGLGDGAIRESRDRVRSALRASGYYLPDVVLVNLAPAELRKEGSSFDVAIALGILVASGQLRGISLEKVSFHGELSLDGRVNSVKGVVALAVRGLQSGIDTLVVPLQNIEEASLIEGIASHPVSSFLDIVAFVKGERSGTQSQSAPIKHIRTDSRLGEVWGQERAKRALTVAAAGSHNILMIGPPGCGKSMLAERFPTILPPLTEQEMLETVKIHSIGGLPLEGLLKGERPFRAPHHNVSDAGLTGGGSLPRPGEISLAHRGVLFLDEFPEYRRTAIESLRAPLESGVVTISRAKGSWIFPARFQLVAAMNPCPCGRLGSRGQQCMCSKLSVQNYLRKISQPILERIDMHVQLEPVPVTAMAVEETKQTKEECVRGMINQARALQHERTRSLNAFVQSNDIKKFETLPSAMTLLERAAATGLLSARGFVRMLKVARTIADLSAAVHVEECHVAEAMSYRSLDMIQRYCAAA